MNRNKYFSDSDIPDSIGIVRAWLDIPDHEHPSQPLVAHTRSSSRDDSNHTLCDIDTHHPDHLHHTPTHSPTPSHCHHSVVPNLVPSPPPVRLSTSRTGNHHLSSSWLRRNQVPRYQNHAHSMGLVRHAHQLPPSLFPIQRPSGVIFPGPSVQNCVNTPSSSWSAARLPNVTAPDPIASTSSPFIVPSTSSASIVADTSTFVRNLSSTISSGKRKRSYASQSHTSATSDIRTKRRAMQRLSPPLSYVFGPLPSPPHSVATFLARFDMARIEHGCIPWTPGVEALLHAHNPLAYYPPHARNHDIPTADEPHALALATWAISVYALIISCTERAQDEATWSAPVRQLLSILPPSPGSRIPVPPPVVACDQLLTTIDATTKLTRRTILPDYPTVKLDALVAFNPTHPSLHSITRAVARHGLVVNALSDAAIDDSVVLLGVEIKGPSGDAAPATAEYQLGVWGAKTLEVARQLAGAAGASDWCDVVVGLTVCGHTWSAYVVFWEEDEDGEIGVVVYGPVEVASSANLYGVFKVVAWMAEVNVWAGEVLECWKERVAGARERSGGVGREV